MILNPDKYHYMCLGKDTGNDMLKFRDKELEASTLEIVLETEIDRNLNFEERIKALCSKAVKNLNALQ